MLGVLLLGGIAAAQASPDRGSTADVSADSRPHPRFQSTPWPDRIVLTPAANPSVGMSVSWRTDDAMRDANLELTAALDGPGSERRAHRWRGTSSALATQNGDDRYHNVMLTGLHPDSRYLYRVRGSGGWSEWLQFRTAAADDRPFTMLYFGDIQNRILSEGARVLRAAYAATPNVALALHAGDLVAQGKENRHDDDWGEWSMASGPVLGSVPQIPIAGNHEYRDERGANGAPVHALGPHWSAQFKVPGNGAAGLSATTYYVDYQGVRLVALDGTSALEHGTLAAQAAWLDRVLKSRGDRFAIVSMHQPVFTCARPNDTEAFKRVLVPIFEARGVDLVLQGHDHCFSRTGQAKPGAPQGPVYIVSVSGPKMYGLNARVSNGADRFAADTQLYHRLDVDHRAGTIHVQALTPTGSVYDDFTLLYEHARKRLVAGRQSPATRICQGRSGPDGLPCAGRDVSFAR
jgi:hypothetical protein